MPDNDTYEETSRWLKYAYGDINSATAGLEKSIIEPRHACMLAQQSTEKALKSAIIWLGIPVPKTHDLVFLQRRLPGEWRIRLFSNEELNTLSNWAVESRYPGENPEPVREDAEFSIATAQHVLEAITADLATVGYHPNN